MLGKPQNTAACRLKRTMPQTDPVPCDSLLRLFNLIFFLHHMLLFLLIDYPKQVQLGLVINDVLIGLSGLVEWSKRMKSKMSTSTICLRKNSKLISPSLIVRLR